MDKFQLSVTVLLTGFIVVFVLLLVLIIAIKSYSTAVTVIQKKKEQRLVKKKKAEIPVENTVSAATPVIAEAVNEYEGLNDEIIAVIAAAVYSTFPQSGYRIKSVKRAINTRSAWCTAGLLDNTRPF